MKLPSRYWLKRIGLLGVGLSVVAGFVSSYVPSNQRWFTPSDEIRHSTQCSIELLKADGTRITQFSVWKAQIGLPEKNAIVKITGAQNPLEFCQLAILRAPQAPFDFQDWRLGSTLDFKKILGNHPTKFSFLLSADRKINLPTSSIYIVSAHGTVAVPVNSLDVEAKVFELEVQRGWLNYPIEIWFRLSIEGPIEPIGTIYMGPIKVATTGK